MLILPKDFPAMSVLQEEGAQVTGECPDGIRPLRVLLLNLMPNKAVTELDIARVLAVPDMDVQLLPMKIAGQTYKTTPMSHMERFYADFEHFEHDHFDGFIITGAPVEHLPFEEVRYWPQLCHIMDWARTHVRSTLYICWGAQAGLYHHYGVPKRALPAKCFGVFPQLVFRSEFPLFAGMEPCFPMPNSRHTEVRREDFPTAGSLEIVAGGEESGVGVAMTHDGREVFVAGHLEYAPRTLHDEYNRDVQKGLPIAPPRHYYVNDNPCSGIDFSWSSAAARFYHNWLGMCRLSSGCESEK